MSHRTRTDHRIYGRYNDAVLWPVLIIAIAWLVNLRRTPYRKSAAAVLIGIALAIVGDQHRHPLRRRRGARQERRCATDDRRTGADHRYGVVDRHHAGRDRVARAAGDLRRRCARLAARCHAGADRARVPRGRRHPHSRRDVDPTQLVGTGDRGGRDRRSRCRRTPRSGSGSCSRPTSPASRWDDQRRRAQLYQFALPHHLFERDRGLDDDVGPYVFAPTNDKILKAAGGRILWTDPKIKVSLWKEPSSPPASTAHRSGR